MCNASVVFVKLKVEMGKEETYNKTEARDSTERDGNGCARENKFTQVTNHHH